MRPDTRIEWIETNGLGGYAFGTSTGLPTRRYHGLLIAARKPPVDRRMLFAGIQVEPGDGFAVDFTRDPFPTVIYRQGTRSRPISFIRRTFMRYGHNITVVQFRLDPTSRPFRLSVRILPALRDHHAMGHPHPIPLPPEAGEGGIETRIASRRWVQFSRGEDRAYLFHTAGRFVSNARSIGPIRYLWETRQGMADTEWFYSPGVVVADMSGRRGLDLVFSDRPVRYPTPEAWRRQEVTRRRRIVSGASGSIEKKLFQVADQFVVARQPGNRRTIVAGYPWFTDWGRDTMISLEGLTLVRGEFKAAAEILTAFARAESQGMIPNHYPDSDVEPHYNTVDASLWFFEAGQKFLEYSRQTSFVRRTLYPVYRSILRHHLAGTRFNIHAESSTGLLFSGEKGTQLTWMDAKVDDWVVTPRHGYPVEIQALWYNALNVFAQMSKAFGVDDAMVRTSVRMAGLCRKTFSEKYWYEKGGYLHDCITPEGTAVRDLRPNQLISMSLTHPILDDRRRGRKILSAVRKKLLTPCGLRTLSPDHPDYKGRHEGSRLDRDAAYHQGTVWPWLLGPYARACLRIDGPGRRTRAHLRRILSGFEGHLQECAVGTVSEIFDGDAPHDPKGCVAQAWSVAELVVIAARMAG